MGMTVHAVEPIEWNMELLIASLERNQLDGLTLDVNLYQTSIGREGSSITLSPTVGNMASTVQAEPFQVPMRGVEFPVQLMAISSLLSTDEVQLISLNCQGCELEAVQDLFKSGIMVHHFLIEVYAETVKGAAMYESVFSALEMLADAGYCFSDWHDGSDNPHWILDIEEWQTARASFPHQLHNPSKGSLVIASSSQHCEQTPIPPGYRPEELTFVRDSEPPSELDPLAVGQGAAGHTTRHNVYLTFGDKCKNGSPLRELVVCSGLIRTLSGHYGVVEVEVCHEALADFEILFADLPNVRAAPESTASHEPACAGGRRVLDLGKTRTHALVQLGVAEEEAMYIVAGVPYAASWSRWHLPRNAAAEEAVLAAAVPHGSPFVVVGTSPCAAASGCVPASPAHAALPHIDLRQTLHGGGSLLHAALLLERASELLLGDGPAALLADRLDLARVAVARVLPRTEEAGWPWHRVYARAEWEVLLSPHALGSFEFAFAAPDLAEVALSAAGYATVEFQLSSAALCHSAAASRLGVVLEVNGQEVQRGKFGADEDCEMVRDGLDVGWEGDVSVFLGLGESVHRIAATFDGAFSLSRFHHVRREVRLRAVPPDADREEARAGIRVLLMVFAPTALEDAADLVQGLRAQIRSLSGVSQVHVCLSGDTSLEAYGAIAGAFQERPEHVAVSIFGPGQRDADITLATHPQSWRGFFAVLEYGMPVSPARLDTMVAAVLALDRAAVVGSVGYAVEWGALESLEEDSVAEMLREVGVDAGHAAVDVLELGAVVFHSAVDRAEFAVSVYKLPKRPPALRHLYLAHAMHSRGIPRYVVPDASAAQARQDRAWQATAGAHGAAVVLDMLPRITIDVQASRAEGRSWREDEGKWEEWWQSAVRALALESMRLNHPGFVHVLCSESLAFGQSMHGNQDALLPAARTVVFNLAHDTAKRRHMEALTASLGLTDVSFTDSTLWHQVELGALTEEGLVSASIMGRLKAYQEMPEKHHLSFVAQAVDQVRVLAAAAAAGQPVLILEDDLMLAARPAHARTALEEALRGLPATADLVYLEACYETCERLGYNPHAPGLARASAPSCSAAILWTERGAARAARLCTPVFDAVDRMYQRLVNDGLLEAYMLTPPLLFQDQFWGSNRDAAVGGAHAPLRPVCSGTRAGQLFREAELQQVGVAVSAQSAARLADAWSGSRAAAGGQGQGRVAPQGVVGSREAEEAPPWYVFVGRSLSEGMAEGAGAEDLQVRVSYTTERQASGDGTHTTVGAEVGGRGMVRNGTFLVLDEHSLCFAGAADGVCAVHVRVSELDGTVLRTDKRSLATVGLQLMCQREPSTVPSSSQRGAPPPLQAPAIPSPDIVEAGQCSMDADSVLRGVQVVFDGYFYKLLGGKMTGINKMWFNIVPFMADAVEQLGGTLTHCQTSWESDGQRQRTHLPGLESVVECENLTAAVAALPGKHKIVFSSYYRLAEAGGASVCNMLPIYDFIPERMGDAEQQHWTFHAKSANIPRANGYLSLSNSTTADLQELHRVDARYIATSPNRVSPIFKRVPAWFASDLSDLLEDHATLDGILNSRRRFLLLVGHSRFAGEYKGYSLFWDALREMPPAFAAQFSVLIVGGPPEQGRDPDGYQVLALDQMPEDVLPLFYSRAAALVYPSRYEGFGMPPIEALACGCPVILGAFYQDRMQYVFGDDALYARDVEGMKGALGKVARGEVPAPEKLIARAAAYGEDTRRGWNEVAVDYLRYMLTGPFRAVDGSRCPALLPPECVPCILLRTTHGGVQVEQRCTETRENGKSNRQGTG